MNKLVVAPGLFLCVVSYVYSSHVVADEITYGTWDSLVRDEKAGIRHYKKGNYKRAFERLKLPAQMGLKEAQYALAFMFLKGQYVNQSLDIGMAWLGVANEIHVRDWKQTYDQVYAALSPQEQSRIDRKVATYVDMFGMETQNLNCDKNSGRRISISCQKVFDAPTPVFELEGLP